MVAMSADRVHSRRISFICDRYGAPTPPFPAPLPPAEKPRFRLNKLQDSLCNAFYSKAWEGALELFLGLNTTRLSKFIAVGLIPKSPYKSIAKFYSQERYK
jgi:hypothetical protein